jgi:hypothetical protein
MHKKPLRVSQKLVLSRGEAGYATKGGTIALGAWTDDATGVCTLAHEVAHQILHIRDIEGSDGPRQTRELQAEAVAFAVAKHFGINSDLSGEYIRHFGCTPKDVMANLSTICRASRDVIEGVNAKLNLQHQTNVAVAVDDTEVDVRYYLSEPGQTQRKCSDYEALMHAISASSTPLDQLELEVYESGIGGSFYHTRNITAATLTGELFSEFVSRANEAGLEGIAYHDRGEFLIVDSIDAVPEAFRHQVVELGTAERQTF